MKILVVPFKILTTLLKLLVIYTPGAVGEKLRYAYYKRRLKFIGSGVRISPGVNIDSPELVSIGDNSHIDNGVIIQAALFDDRGREVHELRNKAYKGRPGEVFIGRNVHIGAGCIVAGNYGGVFISDDCGLSSGVKIYALTSHYRSRNDPSNINICFGSRIPPKNQCVFYGAIQLDRNVGVALNAVVLPGAHISENSFIGIGVIVEPKSKIPVNSAINAKINYQFSKRFELNDSSKNGVAT